MSLSDQDLEAIGRLMDQKLAVVQTQDRRRRKFWIWFWIIVTVLSSLASWLVLERLKVQVNDWVAERNQEFVETKLAYQRQLEQSQQRRDERKKAEQAVGYDTNKSQAEHEADLMGGLISLIGAQAEFNKKFADADTSDPAVMDAYLKNFEQVLDKGLKPLGTVVLRNTDPAHNSPDEKLRAGEGRSAPAPELLAAPGSTTEPAVAPKIEPAAAPALETPKP